MQIILQNKNIANKQEMIQEGTDMANIYQGTLGLIGNTPLVEVTNIEKAYDLKARVLVKLEYFNPAGSVKDRIAKAMIEDAEVLYELRHVKDYIQRVTCKNCIQIIACKRYKKSSKAQK